MTTFQGGKDALDRAASDTDGYGTVLKGHTNQVANDQSQLRGTCRSGATARAIQQVLTEFGETGNKLSRSLDSIVDELRSTASAVGNYDAESGSSILSQGGESAGTPSKTDTTTWN
ncbi:WXG100 family type VII secretion target [Nocardia yamanashiensis]|uniref:WXG100 family type VII secretion target n=1 Tax=Nocardia yamanashiensis TaxID=209247 RepID=UPI0012FE24C7|nr:WXG100 family type VII secretion target [Nocardia yamanashiensis]